MVRSFARAMGAIVVLAAIARAGDPVDHLRPGNPIIDFPGNGDMVPAEKPLSFRWHMPEIFALPAGYEVNVEKDLGGKWVRAAHGLTSGRAKGTMGLVLEPGTYVVYLTAQNNAGTATAAPHIFKVMPQAAIDKAISQVTTRTETNPDGSPKAPSPGTAGKAGGGGGTKGSGIAGAMTGLVDPPGAKPNDAGGPVASKGESSAPSAAPKPEKPLGGSSAAPEKNDTTAATPRPEPRKSAPDSEVEETGSVEGSVKPGHGATGAGAGVNTERDPEERRSVRGRLLVLSKDNAKRDFAKTIARVDAAVERLKAEDARAEAGEETTEERVAGELEVWVVEIPKAPKKKGAAMQPVRRYRVDFEDPAEASRLRDKNGHKIALDGLFRASEETPKSGEAGDLSTAKIVFMAPPR